MKSRMFQKISIAGILLLLAACQVGPNQSIVSPTVGTTQVTPYIMISATQTQGPVHTLTANSTQGPARIISLESDATHIIDIAKTVKLLHPASVAGNLAYPSGPMHPEDEAFWGTTRTTSSDLTFKEYAIVPDAQASPRGNAPFDQNFPADVVQRFALRDGMWYYVEIGCYA